MLLERSRGDVCECSGTVGSNDAKILYLQLLTLGYG